MNTEPTDEDQKPALLFPGSVKSETDGEWHHISFLKLCELSNMDTRMCINGREPWALKGLTISEHRQVFPRAASPGFWIQEVPKEYP